MAQSRGFLPFSRDTSSILRVIDVRVEESGQCLMMMFDPSMKLTASGEVLRAEADLFFAKKRMIRRVLAF